MACQCEKSLQQLHVPISLLDHFSSPSVHTPAFVVMSWAAEGVLFEHLDEG